MDTVIPNVTRPANIARPVHTNQLADENEAPSSGVSWGAVIAGAFVAAAFALILLALGTGLGLSAVSPWANMGASAAAVGIGTIVWLVVTQFIASAMGGYLAGRLRTKWVDVHTDEVFFRDTAHGFLVWAVGLVITASFLASAASSLLGSAAKIGAGAVAATAGAGTAAIAANSNQEPSGYLVDSLFRSSQPNANAADSSMRTEVSQILANGLRENDLPPADKAYLGQLVAAKSGLSQTDADRRVSEVIAQAQRVKAEAQQAADVARKTAVHLSLWTFLALLIGAFCASYAATIGGRQRDQVVA